MIITNYSNTKTNNQETTLFVSKGEIITFSITTDNTPTRYKWYVNYPEQTETSNTLSFTVPIEDNVWTIHVDAMGIIPIIGAYPNETVFKSWHLTTVRIDNIYAGSDIQTGINSLIPGTILQINDGIYQIPNEILVNKDNIIVKGTGNTTLNTITTFDRVFRTSESGHNNITFSQFNLLSTSSTWFGWSPLQTQFVGVSNLIIENMIQDGGSLFRATPPQGNGLFYCDKLIIRNNKNTGIGTSRLATTMFMMNVHIYNNVGKFDLDINRDVNGTDNIIENNTLVGNAGNYMIRVHGGINFIIQNNDIANHDSTNNSTGGIGVDGGDYYIIRNNYFYGIAQGLRFQKVAYTEGFIIKNNIFNGNNYGLRLVNYGGNLVYIDFTENTIINSLTDGILVETTTGYITNIKNNIIVNSSNYNINVLTGTLNNFNYNDVWGAGISNYAGTSNGVGNISQNPQFADILNNDFHLKSLYGRYTQTGWITDTVHSPCINAGDPTSDASLEPDTNIIRIDIGNYGNTSEASLSGGIIPCPEPICNLTITEV